MTPKTTTTPRRWPNLPLSQKRLASIGIAVALAGLAILSFSTALFFLFAKIVPVSLAYSIDQYLPLAIAITASIFVWWRHHKPQAGILISIDWAVIAVIAALGIAAHWGITEHYFFKEDFTYLSSVKHDLETGLGGNYRFFLDGMNYPYGHMAPLYLLGGMNALIWNILALFFHALSSGLIYLFFRLLSGSRLVAAITAVLFATTPALLDSFTFTLNQVGYPLMSVVFWATLIVFWRWVQDPTKRSWVLALLWIIACLKLGFVRTAILPVGLIAVGAVAWARTPQFKAVIVWRTIGAAIAICAVGLFFALKNYFAFYAASGSFRPSSFTAAFVTLAAEGMPFEWAQDIRSWWIGNGHSPFSQATELVALTVVGALVVSALAAVMLKRSRLTATLVIMGTVLYITSMGYSAVFGVAGSSRAALDHTFFDFAYTPGSRYLHLGIAGYFLIVGVFVERLVHGLGNRLKYVVGAFLVLPLMIAFVVQTRSLHQFFNANQSRRSTAFFHALQEFIPASEEPIVLYLPRPTPISALTGGSENLTLYGLRVQAETNDWDQLVGWVKGGKVPVERIFALDYQREPFAVNDQTAAVRSRLGSMLRRD